ncbi:hypothetical protein PF241_12100 [Staphylococcus pseudintermedius]|uniref:hypothetical protein n=1 Tax=Staphylococcus pseudintermedius TaxID=283734 RepID=UPI0018F6E942|nr:hypothetical protein [Staphylococcus pseudintermedius]EGQ3886894.1 hypothetical protein [Staphylococcus pseudintermedius]MBJ8255338.1 hypothetical protein [Staphylococcus pseudintermedius]MBJ8255355.1 hypothetical protein [Staphylococcus pseudintermedius]
MNRPIKIIIVIGMIILMFVFGLLIPNQFNDKPVTDNTKQNIENKEKEKERIDNLPQNLSNSEFMKRYDKQGQAGQEFVTKYYTYDFKDPEKNFNESLTYIDDEFKKGRDLKNDELKSLIQRDVTINKIEPVQDSSKESQVTFKYDINLKETHSAESMNKDKAKKDSKYLDKVKKDETQTNKVISVTFSTKSNKIIDMTSNYL